MESQIEATEKRKKCSSLSQEQYDLILAYFAKGIKPSKDDLQAADLGGSLSKRGSRTRFQRILKRFQYRHSDKALVFIENSKIVLPNTKFDEVIISAHRSRGDRHLNIGKTLEKLSQKYTIGSRQFGPSEENVRDVIHACRQGSCAKRTNNIKDQIIVMKINEPSPKKPTIQAASVPNKVAAQPVSLYKSQTQTLKSIATPGGSNQTVVGIPCVLTIPKSMSQGTHAFNPCFLYNGPVPVGNENILGNSAGGVTVASSTGNILNLNSQSGSMANFMVMPTPTTLTPNLVQLLSVKKDVPNLVNQTVTTIGGPVTGHSSKPIAVQMLAYVPFRPMPNHQLHTIGSSSKSTSLTTISQTNTALYTQQVTAIPDSNNKSERAETSSHTADKPLLDSKKTKEVNNNPSLLIYQRGTDVSCDVDPYSKFTEEIQELKPAILQSIAGNHLARESLKRKMVAMEHKIHQLQQLTKKFAKDDHDEEDSCLV